MCVCTCGLLYDRVFIIYITIQNAFFNVDHSENEIPLSRNNKERTRKKPFSYPNGNLFNSMMVDLKQLRIQKFGNT